MFGNASVGLPKCFADKVVADDAMHAIKSKAVIAFREARQARANVLIARSRCEQFVRNALKP